MQVEVATVYGEEITIGGKKSSSGQHELKDEAWPRLPLGVQTTSRKLMHRQAVVVQSGVLRGDQNSIHHFFLPNRMEWRENVTVHEILSKQLDNAYVLSYTQSNLCLTSGLHSVEH